MKRLIIRDNVLIAEGITIEELKVMYEAWKATLTNGIIWTNVPVVLEGDFSKLFEESRVG